MPRRFASQVHIATSRLLKAGVLQQPPVWYNAVLAYPPIPLPPRDAPRRPASWTLEPEKEGRVYYHTHQYCTNDQPKNNPILPFNLLTEESSPQNNDPTIPFDLPAKEFTPKAQGNARRSTKTPPPRIRPIEYTEDRIRKQFFRDHPFEALRPRSLVEQGTIREEHPIQGKEWTKLSEHGRTPASEEAIRFAVCLHEHHKKSITEAYHTAVAQFRALRVEHHMSTLFARNEALFYGAKFLPNQTTRAYILQNKALGTWTRAADASTNGAFAGRQRRTLKGKYFPVWEGRLGVTDYWSRGVGYTKRWMKDMPPPYWPTKEERQTMAIKQKAASATRSYGNGKNKQGKELVYNPFGR